MAKNGDIFDLSSDEEENISTTVDQEGTDNSDEEEADTNNITVDQEGIDNRDEDVCENNETWTWSRTKFNPQLPTYCNEQGGIQPNQFLEQNPTREVNYFYVYFNYPLITYIVQESNRYFLQSQRRTNPSSHMALWTDIDVDEMYVFLALSMLMAFTKKHTLASYWSQDELTRTPAFSKYFSRDRYITILKYLHFADNQTGVENRLKDYKISYIFNDLKNKMSTLFYPFQKLVIDESLMLFKGRLSWKQYIPSKRHRWGIKLFILCDCETGIILNMIIYTGGDTLIPKSDPLGVSGAVVKELTKYYLGKGHIVYTDNWYTSPSLCRYLMVNNTGACGTVKKNRKHIPKNLPKVPKGECASWNSNGVMLQKWRDKRDVHLLTTVHGDCMVDSGKNHHITKEVIMKPATVLDYNINMRLVDKSDMVIETGECLRRCLKWYKKLFFHLVDISLYNAYNMYLTNNAVPPPGYSQFVKCVISQLLDEHGTVRKDYARRERLGTSGHYAYEITATLKTGRPRRACHVCANTQLRKQTRKMTHFICKKCHGVPLCIGKCFEDFHTLEVY